MRILVTGGCGFVGRHFVTKLLETDDNEILVVDNLVSGLPSEKWAFQPRYKNRLRCMFIDVRSFFRGTIKHRSDDFDLIIHCAAIVGGRLNIENDPLAVATDLSIDSEFFNWVVRGKILPKVIYFSSSAVYANELQTKERRYIALNESLMSFDSSRIAMPDLTYGWAKLSGEYLAKFAAEKYGLDVNIYRPFGGYGEDQDFSYPFPSIIRRILEKQNPVVVWGSGEQQRDFIHIDDIVDGVLRTMHQLMPGEVLNLGNGVGVSFRKLAEVACRILDYHAPIVNDSTKPEGVFCRVSDNYKMKAMFEPKVWLEQGIQRVANHLQKTLVSV